MTGCEVLARNGTECALIKVRHSGAYMHDLLKQNPPDWTQSPKQILEQLLGVWLAYSGGTYDLDATRRLLVFIFDTEETALSGAIKVANRLLNEASDKGSPDVCDDYACDYSDHRILLDVMTRTIHSE